MFKITLFLSGPVNLARFPDVPVLLLPLTVGLILNFEQSFMLDLDVLVCSLKEDV